STAIVNGSPEEDSRPFSMYSRKRQRKSALVLSMGAGASCASICMLERLTSTAPRATRNRNRFRRNRVTAATAASYILAPPIGPARGPRPERGSRYAHAQTGRAGGAHRRHRSKEACFRAVRAGLTRYGPVRWKVPHWGRRTADAPRTPDRLRSPQWCLAPETCLV